MNFGLGPDPPLTLKGGRSPQLVGALGRDPKGARSSERTAAISVAVAEKIAFEIFLQRHLAATPFHVHQVPVSRPILCENFASLGSRIWPLFDFIEISKCPPPYGNARHRIFRYIRVHTGQK